MQLLAAHCALDTIASREGSAEIGFSVHHKLDRLQDILQQLVMSLGASYTEYFPGLNLPIWNDWEPSDIRACSREVPSPTFCFNRDAAEFYVEEEKRQAAEVEKANEAELVEYQ